MTQTEALTLALKALKENIVAMRGLYGLREFTTTLKAVKALEEALAQPEPSPEWMTEEEQTAYTFGWFKALESQRIAHPEQEPVAWLDVEGNGIPAPLYTTPPQRTWVGLTDEETAELVHRYAFYELTRQIEAKLKEKNT